MADRFTSPVALCEWLAQSNVQCPNCKIKIRLCRSAVQGNGVLAACDLRLRD